MAVLQSLLALLTRSVGRIVSALFGWAVVALFGDTSPREKTWLSVLVAAAAAWPLLLLGVIWPRLAAFVLAFVPLPEWVSSNAVRVVWIAWPIAVPFALGIAVASRSRGARSPIPGDRRASGDRGASPDGHPARRIEGGAGSCGGSRSRWPSPRRSSSSSSPCPSGGSSPSRAGVSRCRCRSSRTPRDIETVADTMVETLSANGMAVRAIEPPWWVTAPGRILVRLGGPSFRDYVPERLACFKGSATSTSSSTRTRCR